MFSNFLTSPSGGVVGATNGGLLDHVRKSSAHSREPSRVSHDNPSVTSTGSNSNSTPGRRLSSIGSSRVGGQGQPRTSTTTAATNGDGLLSPDSASDVRRRSQSEGSETGVGKLSRSGTAGKKEASGQGSLSRFGSMMRRKDKSPKGNGVA